MRARTLWLLIFLLLTLAPSSAHADCGGFFQVFILKRIDPAPLAVDPCAPTPTASNVLFIPGIESSRLYYRDAAGIERQVWEPDLAREIPLLAMNSDGASVYALYTKDIIDSLYGNDPLEHALATQAAGADSLEVYGGLEAFLNGLVSAGTIREWRSYPYDWRYGVDDIVRNGTLTEQTDGSIGRVYLADVVRTLASTSPTGKVTLIAHSNGGLVAKALMLALGGAAGELIDRIIFIGTPHFGTPAAIGDLLHGDNFSDIPNFIINPVVGRQTASSIPDPYGLLPSAAYFDHIATPVATFAPGIATDAYASQYTKGITSLSDLTSFVEQGYGTGTNSEDLHTPLALPPTLVSQAALLHAQLDQRPLPPGIQITTIAGWGQQTVSSLAYSTIAKEFCARAELFAPAVCSDAAVLEHTPMITEDGDGTVVTPSATGNDPQAFYFDTKTFHEDGNGIIAHQSLTSAFPLQNLLRGLLTSSSFDMEYLVHTKPGTSLEPLSIISAHSPVNLVATDAHGNETGIVLIPGTDFSVRKEEIPDSSIQIFGDEKYLYVPQSGSYTIAVKAYGSGETTLEIGSTAPEGSSSVERFSDIPTIASTTASFTIDNGVPSVPMIDENGDGVPDFAAASSTPQSVFAVLETQFKELHLRAGIKNRFLVALHSIERDVEMGVDTRNSILALERLIKAQMGVKLTVTQGAEYLELLASLAP